MKWKFFNIRLCFKVFLKFLLCSIDDTGGRIQWSSESEGQLQRLHPPPLCCTYGGFYHRQTVAGCRWVYSFPWTQNSSTMQKSSCIFLQKGHLWSLKTSWYYIALQQIHIIIVKFFPTVKFLAGISLLAMLCLIIISVSQISLQNLYISPYQS